MEMSKCWKHYGPTSGKSSNLLDEYPPSVFDQPSSSGYQVFYAAASNGLTSKEQQQSFPDRASEVGTSFHSQHNGNISYVSHTGTKS